MYCTFVFCEKEVKLRKNNKVVFGELSFSDLK